MWQPVPLDDALPAQLLARRGAAVAATAEGLVVLCGGVRDMLSSHNTAAEPAAASDEAAPAQGDATPTTTVRVILLPCLHSFSFWF